MTNALELHINSNKANRYAQIDVSNERIHTILFCVFHNRLSIVTFYISVYYTT